MTQTKQPPTIPGRFTRLAAALSDLKRGVETIAEYGEALRYDPNNGEIHFQMAQFLASGYLFASAIKEANEAIRCNPENTKYRLFRFNLNNPKQMSVPRRGGGGDRALGDGMLLGGP